ncbi:MAG: hypothetical protein QOE35_489 [Actinomycetota bacterium]
MKYALLGYGPPAGLDSLSPAERATWDADDARFQALLSERGCVVFGVPLDHVTTATTVRIVDGEPVLTDGPFADTSEVLGGILVIDVADLDEALDIAKQCPAAGVGPLEVRPIPARE